MFGFSIHLREKKQKDKILNVTLSSIYNSNDYPWHKKLCIWMGPMVIGQAYKIPRVEVWCLPGTIGFSLSKTYEVILIIFKLERQE